MRLSMFIVFIVLWASGQSQALDQRFKGVCMVAPPAPFKSEPLIELNKLGSNWVAIVPFGYTRQGTTSVHYDNERQWWGERTEGVIESIKRAKEAELKIFLKPHVYVPGSWPGGIDYNSDAEWNTWESQYTDFILHWVEIAQRYEVDALSIGTEFKVSSTQRSQYWEELIKSIRCDYGGLLSYCANWDEYNQIRFWDQLDFIGVDAYFPLSETKTPSVSELVKQWETKSPELEQVSKKFNRRIVFTEYGYLSVDKCADKTWELESKVKSIPINEQAQANAIMALWTHFNTKSWWQGGLYWKWFPEMKGHEGYPERDYTFQGKIAEQTIRKLFTEEFQ